MPPRTDLALAAIIGGRVRAARATLRISQEELAGRAGVPSETISRVEMSRIVPTLPTLGAIAKGLGCELGDLVGAGSGLPAVASVLDEDEQALIERWRRLPAKPRKALREIIDAMLKP